MSQLSFDVIKRVWPKSGLTTFLKSTPDGCIGCILSGDNLGKSRLENYHDPALIFFPTIGTQMDRLVMLL